MADRQEEAERSSNYQFSAHPSKKDTLCIWMMAVSEGAPARLTRAEQQVVTRDRILEAAEAVMTERGLAEATVEEIAARAGYTRGAVYSNFEGKDDLALAIISRRLAVVSDLLEQVPDSSHDPRRAAGVGEDVAELLASGYGWAPLVLEFAVRAARDPGLAERLRGLWRSLGDQLSAIVERIARTQNTDLPIPAERLAIILLAATDGAALERLIDPERADPRLLAETIELLVRGAASKARDHSTAADG